MQVAFVGLGVMGFPMAGHLQQAGHSVTVFNRTPGKSQLWIDKYGGRSADTPALAAQHAEAVFVCVGNDDDVRSVSFGADGALAGLSKGSVLIDHTTASAELARELDSACRTAGLGFLDAPVSGGQQGAESGGLTIMVGGDSKTFDRVRPLLGCYAKRAQLMGPAGSGQLTKMVNQICIAGLVQSLAEGLNFARLSGLDPKAVVDVISQGAAQSWQMDNRHQTMIDGEYGHGFAVDWMRKDLGIALNSAREFGAALPIASLVDQLYAEVQVMGGGRWDTSSLLARLARDKLDGSKS